MCQLPGTQVTDSQLSTDWKRQMKKTRLIQTCVFAVAAVGLCVLGSVAQEQAGYATLSGRPSQPTYAQRQVAAQKASYNAAQAYARAEAQIAQTAYQGIGCTTAPAWNAPAPAPAATGCGSCGQTAATGCGCNSAVPFPSGNCATGSCATGCGESAPCNTAVPFPGGGCATGSCGTGGWGSASLGGGSARRTPVRDWMQSNQRTRQTARMGRQMQASCDPCGGSSYGAGYNNRMNRLLGSRRGNQACGAGGGGGACGTGGGSAGSSFWTRSSQSYQSRNARLSQHLFGWLVPSGNGGQGSPPIGKYHTTYAQNANHFDQRDGEVYAAQGYGTHVTVPLAPNVRHAYNYGWGMPSSRITRVSTVAPYTTLRPLHW